MQVDPYLERVGVDPGDVDRADHATLARLQRAHVEAVPFENLSVAGGEGVDLALPALYAKVVEQRRGGFCYELNGLFGWLLAELGFDVDRVAGRVSDESGDLGPPADHLALLVTLADGTSLVDVGFGDFARRPLPLDGTARSDAGGTWRVDGVDRPDADHVAQSWATEDGWTDEYVFSTTPRTLPYFAATCKYHQTAPESPFTGDPFVTVATETGRKTLSTEALTVTADGEERREPVDADAWPSVLEREFGIPVASLPASLG